MLSAFRILQRETFSISAFQKRFKFRIPSKPSYDEKLNKISLCVLGNGAEGSPSSVCLEYNDKLFLFNCGEGTTRRMTDLGLKTAKIEQIFLTSPNFHNYGGISSLFLSRYDAGIKSVSVSGLSSEQLTKDMCIYDVKHKRTDFSFPDPSQVVTHNDLTIRPVVHRKSVIYTCELAPQSGILDLDKCFHAGIPRQLLPALERGEEVRLPNGNLVDPATIFHPAEPSKKFAFFEYSSLEHLQAINENPSLLAFFQSCDLIVHFARDRILASPQYRQFMDSLKGLSKNHILLSESNSSLSLYSVYRYQKQLNMLDSKVFPMLPDEQDLLEGFSEDIPEETSQGIHRCHSGGSYQLRPTVESSSPLHYERVSLDVDDVLTYKDGAERVGIQEAIDALKVRQEEYEKQQESNPIKAREYPEFVFLGTASSSALSVRNVSGILVNLSPDESILLDCGENTYNQLLKFYGKENIGKVMKSLKTVFISHHHSDHQMGLLTMILKHYQYTGQPLQLILPPLVSTFFNNLSDEGLEDLRRKFNYVINKRLADKPELEGSIKRNLKSVAKVQLISVNHCAYAYGISIENKDGFRFVYSGDTQPCQELLKAATDCDLLIHEATVESNLERMARSTFHTTMGEAIEIANKSRAKFTILTHFSQRYGKLPLMPEGVDTQNVGLAFDFMKVSPADFGRLPLMREALECMYSRHILNLQYKSEMYERRKLYRGLD